MVGVWRVCLGYGCRHTATVLDSSDGQQASCVDTGGDFGLSDWRVVFLVFVLLHVYEVGQWGAGVLWFGAVTGRGGSLLLGSREDMQGQV